MIVIAVDFIVPKDIHIQHIINRLKLSDHEIPFYREEDESWVMSVAYSDKKDAYMVSMTRAKKENK